MTKQDLFEQIRHEDVAIWAGAGLSKYAGYPLGNELKMLIYKALSEAEQKELDPDTYSLAAMAKEFIRFRDNSSTELLALLHAVYGQVPEHMELHGQLRRIPHFHTAITTNYDNLFELAYAGGVNKLVENKDVALGRKDYFNVVKFHGDLAVPESVILSEQDYARLYNADRGAPLHAFVTDQVSSHVVLFLGYGYEDLNVWALFDKISEYLAGFKKQAFFVAPDMPERKIKALKDAGITYIDRTAECFLDELLADIKANIMSDFRKKKVSPETYRRFLNYHNIEPGLNGTVNGFELDSLTSVDKGPLKSKLTLSVPNEDEVVKKIDDFFVHNNNLELELSTEDIKAAQINIEGIALHEPGQSFETISFQKQPSLTYEFKLVFFSHNFELLNLKADLYYSPVQSIMLVKIHSLNVKIITTRDGKNFQLSLSYQHNPVYTNTKEELEVYHFLKYAFSGSEATILFHNGSRFSHPAVLDPNEMHRAQAYIDYLEKLQKIESYFKIKFQNFSGPNKGSENVLNTLISIINGESFDLETDDSINFIFKELQSENIAAFEKISDERKAMRFAYDNDDAFDLHGEVFRFPRKQVVISSVEIINLAEIKSGADKTIKVISRTGIIKEQYLLIDDREGSEDNI